MIGGVILVTWIARGARANRYDARYYTPVEIFGLYWSLVDGLSHAIPADIPRGDAAMSISPPLAIWLILMLLLGREFLVRGVRAVAISGAMAALVALTYMRLVKTGGDASDFALAAVFWLMVMFGLGGIDPSTRQDVGVAGQTQGCPTYHRALSR